MKHRFTIKELENFSDYRLLTELVIERRSTNINIYSPLNKRLMKLQDKLEKEKGLTKRKVGVDK